MTLTNALKKYRTEVIISVVLVFLLIIVDVLVNAPTVNYEPNNSSVNVPTWVNKTDAADALSEGKPLNRYFSAFEQPEKDSTETEAKSSAEKGLSQQEQNKQQGLLKQLYIGAYKYKLLAIVNEQTPTALLQETHIENEQTKVVALTESDTLEPYKVSKLTARQVALVDTNNNQRTIYLKLFVPTQQVEQENGSKN